MSNSNYVLEYGLKNAERPEPEKVDAKLLRLVRLLAHQEALDFLARGGMLNEVAVQ